MGDSIDILKCLLQRKSLSLLLFKIFIAALEDYLREREAEGVNNDGVRDLVLILYCNDYTSNDSIITIFAIPEIEMNKKTSNSL